MVSCVSTTPYRDAKGQNVTVTHSGAGIIGYTVVTILTADYPCYNSPPRICPTPYSYRSRYVYRSHYHHEPILGTRWSPCY